MRVCCVLCIGRGGGVKNVAEILASAGEYAGCDWFRRRALSDDASGTILVGYPETPGIVPVF